MTSIATLRRVIVAAFFLLASAIPALAQERILDFSSDITVAKSRELTVKETILVHSEGRRIQHGIFRDFPTTYPDQKKFVHVRFAVDSVMRDGEQEPYDIESIDNGKRVRIGNGDVVLPPGDHKYLIVYQTDRQIGFFRDYDQLYWNVTGNAWAFPIRHAEAIVHLPEGAKFGSFDVYTGPQGSKGRRGSGEHRGTTMRFFTTAPLADHEGLTFALDFTKGVVMPPAAMQNALYYVRDNTMIVTSVAGFAALALYFFAAWVRFGRDPARGTIIPLFAPPQDLSAASIRFVHKMDYDRKCFAAALVAMAVKGYLRIVEEGRSYVLTRMRSDDATLAPSEEAVCRSLFADGDNRVALKSENHEIVASAIKALKSSLTCEDEGRYFFSNRVWFLGGVAILAMSVAATAYFAESPDDAAVTTVWLVAWVVGFVVLLRTAGAAVRSYLTSIAPQLVFASVLLSAAVISLWSFIDLSYFTRDVPVVPLAALLGQAFLAVIFYHLLKAPTVAGQKIRDEIEGFRMFLDTAEKDRLEVLHPPKVTPEVFEKFLPYAIALDAENSWSKKFEAEAAKAGQAVDARTYVPSWYVGNSFSRLGNAGFASALGSSIASATASAAVAPGGTAGGGGGGFSGGGGGGGGGGGW
jgi:uncharacterized membrane protein YgcG